jgi:2-succinyl-5-enolpyruvyl-6-hydroxy-3-cyclohexene-1-carboxylate synthase
LASLIAHNNLRWADLIIEECVRHGISRIYASPGSRSTALVLAASRHPQIQMEMHVDERASAFLALGYGRAAGKPALWITTSGTALANGYPAVIEASMEAVPMVLLTSDRPVELRDTDANQTIHQEALFGRYVRWFVDVPAPTQDISPTWLLATIGEAVHRAQDGPVHLNCAFRKPLHPDPADVPSRAASLRGDTVEPRFLAWLSGSTPFASYSGPDGHSPDVLGQIDGRMRAASRPLIVLGRLRGNPASIREAARALADAWGAVVAADIGSQGRLGPHDDVFIPCMDAVLYGASVDHLQPDLILQFGASPVSRRLNEWATAAGRIVVDHRPRRIDPQSRGGWRIATDAVRMLENLAAQRTDRLQVDRNAWRASWKDVAQHVREWEAASFGRTLTEQHAARQLAQRLAPGHSLTVASSNAVRHMDSFVHATDHAVPVSCSRGASGIDGTLATACGFADGTGTRPVVLIGDLALLHDLTSLHLCAARQAIVVLLNNDGGGIFSYLPIREHPDVFEPWFGTPHGYGFEHAARQFGMQWIQPADPSAYEEALSAAFSGTQGVLIEVRSDRQANLDEQRALLGSLRERLTP